MARKLVVVGNGMAGVRAIEEILARGGGELFEITVFGDEPYGNYNRILLSNVLAGSQLVDDQEGIYLNALDWYRDNDIDLRAGVRVVRIDRFARLVHADDGTVTRYDNLILATGSRSFFPPMAGLWADDKTLADGVFGFRSLDDCLGHDLPGRAPHQGGGDRRRAARPRGGARAAEPRSGRRRRPCRADADERATRRHRRRDPAAVGRGLGITVHTDKRTTEVRTVDGRLTGIVFSDGSSIDCDMLVIAAGIRPNVGLAQRAGLTVERAIVVDDHMRSVDDDAVYVVGECAQHRGQVYGLVAPLWEQAERAGRPHHRHRQVRGVSRVAHGDQAQGRRRGRRVDGPQGAGASRRRVRAVLRTEARRVQDHRDPGRKAGRRNAAR